MWAVTVISIDRKLLCQLAYKYPTDGLLASRSRARDARNRNRSNSHNVTTPPSVAPCNPRPQGCKPSTKPWWVALLAEGTEGSIFVIASINTISTKHDANNMPSCSERSGSPFPTVRAVLFLRNGNQINAPRNKRFRSRYGKEGHHGTLS